MTSLLDFIFKISQIVYILRRNYSVLHIWMIAKSHNLSHHPRINLKSDKFNNYIKYRLR